MILGDIVTLAKAGFKANDIKVLLEMCETSPKVQEAKAPTTEEAKETLKQVEKDSVVEEKSATPEVSPSDNKTYDIFRKFLEG